MTQLEIIKPWTQVGSFNFNGVHFALFEKPNLWVRFWVWVFFSAKWKDK